MTDDPRVQHGEPPLTWLWDLHPLADGAWDNIQYAANYFTDWGAAPGTAISIRRWVTGPNGPAFLTEYTPADDYITEGYNRRHATYNSLYQDEDRRCYVPLPEDLARVQGIFPNLPDPSNPSWPQVEAELIAAGRSLYELPKMTAPSLIRLLAKSHDLDEHGSVIAAGLESEAMQAQATPDAPAESSPKGELPPRVAKVWDDFQYAIVRIKDKSATDRQVYDWLLVHARDSENMPGKFDTWRRYLRQAREYHGCQKNTPRAGRPMGSSIDTESAAKPIHATEREHRIKRSINQDD